MAFATASQLRPSSGRWRMLRTIGAFEATIIADYDAQSAVERELVLRLASLLWRLRRASTMETGLFDIQADHLYGIRHAHQPSNLSRSCLCLLRARCGGRPRPGHAASGATSGFDSAATRTVDLARCFLRLSNFPNYALDQLSRYEATLWRQVAQTLIALDGLDRRKPQDRRRRIRFGGFQELPNHDRNDV